MPETHTAPPFPLERLGLVIRKMRHLLPDSNWRTLQQAAGNLRP